MLQFISLFFVVDDKGVEIAAASHLELNGILDLLYFHSCNIIILQVTVEPPGSRQPQDQKKRLLTRGVCL